jgi:AAA domain, putative AbiEii toxin, Type IV TA system/AAA ATPase domain
MKYYLFIDNFRGFKHTFIPIADVNFLVGENSTGKTSVLGLLKLFAGPQLLMQARQSEFGDEHVNFGNFSDMVSRHSDDQTYFNIGLVRERSEGKNKPPLTIAMLYTFVEDEGSARLSKFTFSRGTERLSIRFHRNNVWFRATPYATQPTPYEIVSNLMPQWQKEHAGPADGYDKINTAGLPSRIPLLMMLSIANSGTNASLQTALSLPHDIPFYDDVVWIAPIRTKPRRTYDELTTEFSPEGIHTPFVIRRTLRSKKAAAEFTDFIQKVGKSSGLFQDIRIKKHGKEVTAPFEVDIVLDAKPLNLSTVGYGVSQSLPVLTEVFVRPHGSWFAIQQPEVHLHPRAQAALGDVFFEMATVERKHFLIETHSDFAIDRFRMNYRKPGSRRPDSQILFFERRDKHNVVTPLAISAGGELPADQPASYREFFINEELNILGRDEVE